MIDFGVLLESEEADWSSVNPLPHPDAFLDFLRRRALDESVYVRKNALQVLENILKSAGGSVLSADLVRILAEHCRDSSLMVRKLMVGSLTELIKTYPDRDMVVENWVDGVFPLILDVEAKAAEKVHEVLSDINFVE